jgi:hypothetical protein
VSLCVFRAASTDNIAQEEHIEQLKMDLYRYTNDMNLKMQNEWVMYSVLLQFIKLA